MTSPSISRSRVVICNFLQANAPVRDLKRVAKDLLFWQCCFITLIAFRAKSETDRRAHRAGRDWRKRQSSPEW